MHKKHVLPKWDIPPHKELFCIRETPNTWVEIDHKFKACFKEANRKLEDEVARYLNTIRRPRAEKSRCKSRHDSLKDQSTSQLNSELKKDRQQRPRRVRRQVDQTFVDPAVQSKSCFSLALSSVSASSEGSLPIINNDAVEGSETKREEYKDVQNKPDIPDTVTEQNVKNSSFLKGLKQLFSDLVSSRYYDTICRPALLMISVILALRYFSSLKKSPAYIDSMDS